MANSNANNILKNIFIKNKDRFMKDEKARKAIQVGTGMTMEQWYDKLEGKTTNNKI